MTPTECRKAIAEKREQRAAIHARLADATGKDKMSLRLEDAKIAEDINTLGRVLRDLMPQHHIGETHHRERNGPRRAKSGGWSKLETLSWNEIGLKTWKELEAETNSEDIAQMMQATRETMDRCSVILSEKQNTYFSAVGQTMEWHGRGSKRQADVAANAGVDPSTVSRTVQRARGRVRREAKLRYEYLRAVCENGSIRLDASDRETMEILLSTLSERQLLYMTLYYGNWMTSREVGNCVGVDHSTVTRTIGRGLDKLSALVSGRAVELSGVPELEMRIMECLNQIPPEASAEKEKAHGMCHRNGRRIFHIDTQVLRLRRDVFLTVVEKGKLGELLRRKHGLYALVLRAVSVLKRKIRKGD